MPTATSFARLIDALPLVDNAAVRDALFTNPAIKQRVHRLDTGYVEMWTGTLWVPVLATGAAGPTINVLAMGAKGDGQQDDSPFINNAFSAAGIGGTVYLPPGTYLLNSQIKTTAVKQTLLGAPGAILQRKPGAIMPEGPAASGAFCMIYLAHAECQAIGFAADGNAANMGWSIDATWSPRGYIIGTDTANGKQVYSVLVGAPDCLVHRLHLYGAYSGNAYGGGLVFYDPVGGQLSVIRSHDNGGDGVNIFRRAAYIVGENVRSYSNGVGGLEVEGDGVITPSHVVLSNLVLRSNAGVNLNIVFADSVDVSDFDVLGGGNDGQVKLISSSRVSLANFTIRAPDSWAASPHGLWLHNERGYPSGNQQIEVANGTVSASGTATVRGDCLKLTDNTVGMRARGLRLVGAQHTGFGVSIDSSTYAPTDLDLDVWNTGHSGGNFDNIGATLGKLVVRDQGVDSLSDVLLADGAVTFDASTGKGFRTQNSGGTTITSITGGRDGMEITLRVDANTGLQSNGSILLKGGVNYIGSANATITLRCFAGIWYEKARQVPTRQEVVQGTVAVAGATTVNVSAVGGEFLPISFNAGSSGAAVAIANPSSVVKGQKLTLGIFNNSGGALGAITFGTNYRLSGAFVAPATGNWRFYSFESIDGTVWRECYRSAADQAN